MREGYYKEYYQKNKEKLKKRSAEWREKNKEKLKKLETKTCIECGCKFTTEYSTKIYCNTLCKQRYHRKTNPKKYKEYRDKDKEKLKEWREKNKNKKKLYDKKYYQINKEKINKNFYNKLNSDRIFKLKHSLRNLISISFKRRGYSKNSKTHEILGCSYEDFITHIESKMESWMTWDNYGKYNGEFNFGWDFDHITPLHTSKTEDDVINLNHYTNIQPLCSKINRDIKPHQPI